MNSAFFLWILGLVCNITFFFLPVGRVDSVGLTIMALVFYVSSMIVNRLQKIDRKLDTLLGRSN